MTKTNRGIAGVSMLVLVLSCGSCAEKKTHKVTIEGPEKKTELKLETTKK